MGKATEGREEMRFGIRMFPWWIPNPYAHLVCEVLNVVGVTILLYIMLMFLLGLVKR
jgi:hypothetical protein